MFNSSEKRGIKRKADSEWGMNEDNTRCSDGQFWKRYLYDLDAFVYEAFLDSDPNMLNFGKWMVQFENVPKCFIIKYHDLVHPMMLEYMVSINHLTQDEGKSCRYPMGYPSKFYFG